MDKKPIKYLLHLMQHLLSLLKKIGRLKISKKNIWILLGLIGIAILTYVALDEPDDPENLLVAQIKQGPMPKPQSTTSQKPAPTAVPVVTPPEETAPIDLPPTSVYFNPSVAKKVGEDYLPVIGKDGDSSIKAYAQPPIAKEKIGEHTLSVIIGGLGDNLDIINQVLQAFPTTTTLAFYPDGTYVKDTHPQARTKGYETILMIPLESMGFPLDDPGPLTLLTGDDQAQRLKNLQTCLGKVTGYVGVMNSGGSRFLRIDRCQRWLLEYIKDHGLLYGETKNYLPSLTPEITADINTTYVPLTPSQDQTRSLERQLSLIQTDALQHAHTVGYITIQNLSQIPVVQEWLGKLAALKITLIPLTQSWMLIAQSSVPVIKGKPASKTPANKPANPHG